MPITERNLERSTSLPAAADRFLDAVGDWIDGCMAHCAGEEPSNARGQLSYTAAWEPYLRARPSPEVMAFLARRRDAVRDHFVRTEQWRHGYWRMQDVRQGTEHFAVFLRFLARLNPEDANTRAQLLDAAEHFGNWNPDVPAWYEPRSGLFRSLHFGADGILEETAGWNMPDHLRCLTVCLAAYDLGGGDRYLELARAYAGVWASAILQSEELPAGLNVSGPFFELSQDAARMYRTGLGMATLLDTDPDRAENILAAGGVNVFLTLWRHTRENRFRQASESLLDLLLPQLADPSAGALADLIRLYRQTTGDTRYDEAVRAAAAALSPYEIRTIGVQPHVMRLTRTSGVGKRADMPVWFENLHLRRHNPVLLSLAAEINSDAALATLALDLGRAYFELARDTLPEGRENGDAANTVSAVARGHGRDNGSGVVTAVLGPLLEAAIPVQIAQSR
jgi:hypothetical protein